MAFGFTAMRVYDVKKDIIEAGRRCWLRGWVAANDGNISVRISDNEILTTATGQSKGFLTPDLIVKVDRRGQLLEGDRPPSTEIQMHLLVYDRRPDVRAVFHAHPPYCTAHAVAGLPLNECVLPEIVVTLGSIPLAPYGTPSTSEIPDALAPLLDHHDAFLLQNHGALTLGKDIFQAYYRMESIEHFAHILYLARGLGAVNLLDRGQVEKLKEIRSRYGLQGEVPVCRYRDASADPDPFRLANLMGGLPAAAPPPAAPANCPAAPPAQPEAPATADPALTEAVIRQVLEKLRSRQE